MLELFTNHNLFKVGFNEFVTKDYHLKQLCELQFVFDFPLADTLPIDEAGIYIITGGRQIGKSTLLKQVIKRLLSENITPQQIFYIPCDLFDHFSQLVPLFEEVRTQLDDNQYFYLFLDEITYVKEWERVVKFFADQGFFKKGAVVITGSDTVLLKQAMALLPGRRGLADFQDFHLHPLSFAETISIYDPPLFDRLSGLRRAFRETASILYSEPAPAIGSKDCQTLAVFWQKYLITGGYLTAINQQAAKQKITQAIYQTYLQWIFGDLMKRGKNLVVAREIFLALINCLGSQVSWNSLTNHLSIDHHQTVSDYLDLLSRMDVVLIHQAFVEDKKTAAPKKAKKVFFRDPFIFHALNGYCGQKSSFFDLAQNTLSTPGKMLDALHEQTLVALAHRSHSSFYIKAEGEVDLVILQDKKFTPIEIKNTNHLRANELKQITKYKNGIIAASVNEVGFFGDQVVCPIPLMGFLLA